MNTVRGKVIKELVRDLIGTVAEGHDATDIYEAILEHVKEMETETTKVWVVLMPLDEESEMPDKAFTSLEKAQAYCVEELGLKQFDGETNYYQGKTTYRMIYPTEVL